MTNWHPELEGSGRVVVSSPLIHLLGDLKPLHVAAFIGNEVILEMLINKLGAKEIEQADKSGDRALHYAAISDAYKSIHILLDHGAEVNSRNNAGTTYPVDMSTEFTCFNP